MDVFGVVASSNLLLVSFNGREAVRLSLYVTELLAKLADHCLRIALFHFLTYMFVFGEAFSLVNARHPKG